MTNSFLVDIKPELLRWAIKTSGYEETEVAKSVGVTPEVIGKWLDGLAAPTWRQLKKLAKKTKRPIAAFYLPAPPKERSMPMDFRKRSDRYALGRYSPKLLAFIREARSIRNDAEELLDIYDEPVEFPKLPRFTVKDEPAKCASQLRNHLGITIDEQLGWANEYLALNSWRDVLFRIGVMTVQLPINTEEARGLSEYHDRLSLILVSSKEDPCARIFTIFHELCHLCLRRGGVSEPKISFEAKGPHSFIERFCDRVAGEFLIPTSSPEVQEIINKVAPLGNVDRDELRHASRSLKVSQSAILYRMVDENLLSAEVYSQILEEWSQRIVSRNKPRVPQHKQKIAAVGKAYASLVFEALDSKHITIHEASRMLRLAPQLIQKAREDVIAENA